MKQGWCFAQRSLVQGEPGCEGRGFFAVPTPPQAEHYLPNSLGSTVPGFESGEGRSPHSLSSCSSLSHLPGGMNNFTKTPLATPVPTSPPHSTLPAPPKERAVLRVGQALA